MIVSEEHPGTPEHVWEQCPTLATAPPLELGATRRIVVVAPHPDDEVLGAAGLMVAGRRRGVEVVVVSITDGEASHPGSDVPVPELARLRRAESRTALSRLGLGDVPLLPLGVPDGHVAGHEEAVAEALVRRLDEETTFVVTWRHDGHPDHEASGRAAAVAAMATGARLIEYPVWAWHWARSARELPAGDLRRLELDDRDRAAKDHAIGSFVSQIRPLGDGPADRVVLPPPVLARFRRRFETFIVAGA